MKKYIFLTFAVAGIGGTQIYIRNKLRYLEQNGWDVTVISTEPKGERVYVKDLARFTDYAVPELMDNPVLFTRKKREQILHKMAKIVGDFDGETVIETNFIQVTLWGELLAEKLGARHFVFLIQEDYRNLGTEYLKFYSYKYDRGELAVNTVRAISQLFEDFRNVENPEKAYLCAECSNVIEDCESEFSEKIVPADFHIGSIGRVNKDFVPVMAEDVTRFSLAHLDKTVQLVLFGGSPHSSDYDRIYEITEKAPNLSVLITGPIFPIARCDLEKMDVFISSAGAAYTSCNAGFLTVAIDALDFKPIGVLGITTGQTIHREKNSECITTTALLDEILLQNKYSNIMLQLENTDPDFNAVFSLHMQYLARSENSIHYYDTFQIRPSRLVCYGYKLLGKKRFLKLYGLLGK